MIDPTKYAYTRPPLTGNRGLEMPALRFICKVIGHGIYHVETSGYSNTKFMCPLCGLKLPRKDSQ